MRLKISFKRKNRRDRRFFFLKQCGMANCIRFHLGLLEKAWIVVPIDDGTHFYANKKWRKKYGGFALFRKKTPVQKCGSFSLGGLVAIKVFIQVKIVQDTVIRISFHLFNC